MPDEINLDVVRAPDANCEIPLDTPPDENLVENFNKQAVEDERNAIKELKKENVRIEIAHSHEELKGKRQDRRERKDYASNIFWLMCWWLLFVGIIVWSVGGGWMQLSDAVLITLLGTTTANVLGLMWLVTSYLFPKHPTPTNGNQK